MWNERLPVNIVKFDWFCACYRHYINVYVIRMEGIFEMKSTTHQVVYGIVYINTHMGELFSQYHIELFKFDNQNIFICLYRLLLQLYLHQIINDFNAQATQLPLSARTVNNHAETILVVLELFFFSKYYHCSSFPNRGDLQIDIKRRSRNLPFT